MGNEPTNPLTHSLPTDICEYTRDKAIPEVWDRALPSLRVRGARAASLTAAQDAGPAGTPGRVHLRRYLPGRPASAPGHARAPRTTDEGAAGAGLTW